MRTIFRAVLVALLWTGLFADDLGPPVITSAVLGVGGYWLMLMWPSRRRPSVSDKKRKPMRGGAK
jgi:hypothetical protein